MTYSAEEHPIQIPFFSIQLESKSTSITDTVCKTSFPSDCGKARKERSLLANLVEKCSAGDFGDIMRNFKLSESTCTLGVDESKSGQCSLHIVFQWE